MRVYIAGPMTGLPEYNFPAFHAAAKAWRDAGWEVLNPAEAFDGDTTSGAVLLHAIVHSAGEPPKGTDPDFWRRAVRAYRRRRRKSK